MPVAAPQMRKKLAKSAFQLFAKRGIKNVTLDEVAAHVGVTKGSLYWHYKSKKEVILAACDYYYTQWQKETEAAIALDDDPYAQFERVLRFTVQSCLFDNTNRVFTSEVLALSLQDRDVLAARSQFYDTVRSFFTRLLQAVSDSGRLHIADPRAAAEWVMASIDGIKQRATFDPDICTPAHCEVVVAGLLRIVAVASGIPCAGSSLPPVAAPRRRNRG
jgi:AcrR family transcriptional regulator